MEKREPSYTGDGNVSWYNHYGDQYGDTLENYTQNYHMTQQSHSWSYIQTKLSLKKDTCTRHVHCNSIHSSQDMESTQMSIDRGLDQEDVDTIDYYSATKKKKNEIMPSASTWMELETLTLNEVSQKEKDNYHMIPLICGI